MALSNYPPGVTGSEYPIAGPDAEIEATHHCLECGEEVEGIVEIYGSVATFYHDIADSKTHEIDVTDSYA